MPASKKGIGLLSSLLFNLYFEMPSFFFFSFLLETIEFRPQEILQIKLVEIHKSIFVVPFVLKIKIVVPSFFPLVLWH